MEIKQLNNLLKEVTSAAENAVREAAEDYRKKVKHRLLELSSEYKDKDPPYVEDLLKEMADNLEIEFKRDGNGFHATISWRNGKPEGIEHILYGNREILPMDVFEIM